MDEAKGQKSAKKDPYARLGRRIASVIVIVGIVYLIVVGITSVVPQVFWPEKERLDPSVTCREGLEDLRARMLRRAGDHVESGGSEDRSWMRPFLERWDRRHRALEDRCQGEEREAWVLTARMRERMQSSLERYDENEGALAREVDRTLARRR